MSKQYMYVPDIMERLEISERSARRLITTRGFPLEPRMAGCDRARCTPENFERWYENKRKEQGLA